MLITPLPGAAPPTSDLGMLQRGRGAGWTAAVDSPDGVGLLLECIAQDPRWDSQVEWRDDYYSTLALRLQVAPAVVADIAAAASDADCLARSVLESMARRGAVGAHEALAALPPEDDLDLPPSRDKRPCPPIEAPLDVLLKTMQPCCGNKFLKRFAATTDSSEVHTLRRAALDQNLTWPRWHALRALGQRGDLTALDWATQTLAADTIGTDRRGALRYIEAFPPNLSLSFARDWLRHHDGRGQAARRILAQHAEPDDAPMVLTALSDVVDDYYAVCDLVTALGRLPEHGPYPQLDVVYVEAAYSYARARAADSIAATDPTFAPRLGEECLWDCEDDLRLLGARHTPLTARAVERLREIADDDQEESAVRDAALDRLVAEPRRWTPAE